MRHLFSAAVPQKVYGALHYRQRSPTTSTLIDQLLPQYRIEGITMPYTMDDFRREYVKEHFKELTPDEQQEAIKGLTPEQVLAALTPEQRERLRDELLTERRSGQPKKRRR